MKNNNVKITKMDLNFKEEQKYIRAKKRVNDIKGFYIHLFIYLLCTPIVIIVNLMFAPAYHWFWFSVLGWGLGIFLHWLSVFGFTLIGLGKNWEEKKINEFMNNEN